MVSQFAEGGANGSAALYPADAAGQRARQLQVRESFHRRYQGIATRFAKELATWYPGPAASTVKHAEAFEICEYGTQPDRAALKRLFPFFD
jgi:predicted metal-dependent hydrolase